MRSLWQDIAVVEDTLFQLQKVGDELAATAGHRCFSAAGAFPAGEIYLEGCGGRLKSDIALQIRKARENI